MTDEASEPYECDDCEEDRDTARNVLEKWRTYARLLGASTVLMSVVALLLGWQVANQVSVISRLTIENRKLEQAAGIKEELAGLRRELTVSPLDAMAEVIRLTARLEQIEKRLAEPPSD